MALIIRVDAGSGIGLGHLVRCLAIADASRLRSIRTLLVVRRPTSETAQLIEEHGHAFRVLRSRAGSAADASALLELADPEQDVVLLDGYHFGDDYEQAIADARVRLAVMDDYGHAAHRNATLIINGSLHYAHPLLYSRAGRGVSLLLGPRYAPLRQQFVHFGRRKRVNVAVKRVLVTFGGNDALGSLAPVLEALEAMMPPTVAIFATSSRSAPGMSDLWQRHPGVTWIEKLAHLPETMAMADLAVSAGGITAYELACMGVPAVLLPATAIQVPDAREFAARGTALTLSLADGFPSLVFEGAVRRLVATRHLRQRMSDAGRTLLDGRGAFRIADALAGLVAVAESLR